MTASRDRTRLDPTRLDPVGLGRTGPGPAELGDSAPDEPAAEQPGPARHAELHERVLTWYARHARDLPWRRPEASAWGVLVSEVMLQQTPVPRVLPAWLDWLARWPDPAALAAEHPAEAVRAWGRLGYPRRALRLHAAARAIVAEHAGRVPTSLPDLLALPGVGQYTAAAVAAFAHGRRAVVVDTNVRRVQARVVGGQAQAAPSLTRAEVRRAAELLPPDDGDAAVWNVAVMELGALVCLARTPRCLDCPVRDLCAWQAAGAPPASRRRRTQPWAGTDRQVRGALLAALRQATAPLDPVEVMLAWPADPDAARRCLASLTADGLAQRDAQGLYVLPRDPDR